MSDFHQSKVAAEALGSLANESDSCFPPLDNSYVGFLLRATVKDMRFAWPWKSEQ